jgi:hypothetical protein
LKILITNAILSGRSGTETVVRDLALELKRQGHLPAVFCRRPGSIAHEISDQGIEVVSELSRLTAVPDIIHGHHHPLLVEALLEFPSVPAVWVCHDAVSRLDEPFYFPRILRYVAVDDRCRKRVERCANIPPSRIQVIWNAVDLERFRLRAPLPARPLRALVFSNQTAQLPAVRRACKRMQLKLDTVGLGTGNPVSNPESVLPTYDIVFAKARCALEALAVGNAVVLCDFAGTGPMVTQENVDRLRRMNFGQGALVNPLRAEYLEVEIRRYDALDAAGVSQRIRSDAGLVAATNRWAELYRTVLAEYRYRSFKPEEEVHALAGYIREWHYERRVDWEREQLGKLETFPWLGKDLLRFAKRALHRWTERSAQSRQPSAPESASRSSSSYLTAVRK